MIRQLLWAAYAADLQNCETKQFYEEVAVGISMTLITEEVPVNFR